MNITSQNKSYGYRNITSPSVNNDYDTISILDVVTCLIVGIGLPLTLVAIYALYSQVRNNHVAPIYVINLLISDIIQFCCMIIRMAPIASGVMRICNITYLSALMASVGFMVCIALERRAERNIIQFCCMIIRMAPIASGVMRICNITYLSALMASVGFMVCIALERYLVIAHPLWYRFRRTIKTSVVVCVLVWVLPFVYVLVFVFWYHHKILLNISGVFFFLPLPLFIFFLGGTLKALSASCVPSDEKRRIVGILVLVLLIYTLLFLPTIILLLSKQDLDDIQFYLLPVMFLHLSPLADLTLYIFMRKGTIDKLLPSVCCCRMDSDDTNSSSV